MMLPSKKNRGYNRKGIIMFVVLGAILVLGVLVTSYNYFVRGKFNESREILMHLRASKCAQATSSYIFSYLQNDLKASLDNSAGDTLRNKVFVSNDPDELSRLIKKEWFDKINCNNFVLELLNDTVGNEDVSSEVEFGFSDITPLSALNKDESVYFFPKEKVGRLTIRVTIMIGHTREVWQETRPFKVVAPFPTPITKFSFYWKDGVKGPDPYCFNTVLIKPDNGEVAGNKKPFIFDNGLLEGDANSTDNVWQSRGWIYVGGGDLFLNRACGDKNYGQRYHSYPRKSPGGPPSTLMLDFPGGDKWDEPDYSLGNGEKLGFRVAHWGFSDAVVSNGSDNMWKKILKGEFESNPYESPSNKTYWQSSCLQLFSTDSTLDSNSSFAPSITRVIGNVYDRFMELGYLLPTNSSTSIFAAVINYTDKASFYQAVTEDQQDQEQMAAGITNYTFEKFLFFSNGFNYDNDTLNARDKLQRYFENLEYYNIDNANALSYHAVMSKVLARSMDETYDVIAAYSANSNAINLPPSDLVPKTSEMALKPVMGNMHMGVLPPTMNTMQIDKIGNVNDTTFGMKLRTCYELSGSSDDIRKSLDAICGISSNESSLYLNNLVYRVKSDEPAVNLKDGLNIKSPGTIFTESQSINVGTFNATAESEKSPLLLLAGKGSITIDNRSNSEVMAYLVALGEGGTVKANNKNSPLLIRGGMAIKEFAPENIPDEGGHLVYNVNLDPTGESTCFDRFIGVAFGPKGGKP